MHNVKDDNNNVGFIISSLMLGQMVNRCCEEEIGMSFQAIFPR